MRINRGTYRESFAALLFIWSVLTLFSCASESTENADNAPLFVALDSSQTGISFQNSLYNQKSFNIFNYRNFYNGGGVALGDLNNDGLPDMYLTSNLGKNKLFLNQGGFSFKDISKSSGTQGTKAWSTGVVMVDINADGLLDIYVCNAGNIKGDDQKNELFINNGDLTFSEKAEDYNLADSGFTTHAAFFDYDQDGDLDVYLLNNSFIPVNTLNFSNKRELRSEDWDLPEMFKGGGDKLLRNDNGKFVDVSEASGIYGSLIGFGLGVTVSDINADGYLDIYVSNDFFERDYLYINQQDGTFSEEITEWMSHISMFSMGADIADINNDGHPEVFVTDMLPEGDTRLKNTTHFDTYDLQERKKELGFYHQIMQNTLQLNVSGKEFLEISNFANVARTDWSWGALLFDMDNDGLRDIYVCNGIYKDLTNQDFIDFFANDVIREMVLTGKKEEIERIVDKMPSHPISNYAFKNNGDLSFVNAAKEWGLDAPSFSNGASYADLDNDGDLDLVVNNVNQPLTVFKNLSSEQKRHHYLKIKLTGDTANTFAVGSKIEIMGKTLGTLVHEVIPSRGFQSSTEYTFTAGLGNNPVVDSLKITWPGGAIQVLKDVEVDTTLSFFEKDAYSPIETVRSTTRPLLKEISSDFAEHVENNFVDFDRESLVYEMLSREGPVLAVGDLDNDGDEDIYVGASRGGIGTIYLQQENGQFLESIQTAFVQERNLEDTAAHMFDVDNDGDLDLLVGSGGNETNYKQWNINRLYLNNGEGLLGKARVLPSTSDNVSVIAPYDFDQDGDMDLFIGARSVPNIYGLDPGHLLLRNDGSGNFSNVTAQKAPGLEGIGMITDGKWANMDDDPEKELVLTLDWGHPMLLKFQDGQLKRAKSSLDNFEGWWQTVVIGDLDRDGDNDLVLGNNGLNTAYKADINSPMQLYVNDFDENGTVEQLVTRRIEGLEKPVATKHEITKQLPELKKQNLKFSEYAEKGIRDIFPSELLSNAIVRKATQGESIIALNKGDGIFEMTNLPREAQFSNIGAITLLDINEDGLNDIIYGGNKLQLKPQFSRNDASYGGILLQRESGFEYLPFDRSGFFVEGKITAISKVKGGDKVYLVVGVNDGKPRMFTLIND